VCCVLCFCDVLCVFVCCVGSACSIPLLLSFDDVVAIVCCVLCFCDVLCVFVCCVGSACSIPLLLSFDDVVAIVCCVLCFVFVGCVFVVLGVVLVVSCCLGNFVFECVCVNFLCAFFFFFFFFLFFLCFFLPGLSSSS
jgi:hypothetical protein